MARNTQRSTREFGGLLVPRGLINLSRKLGRIVPWRTRAIATWNLPVELNEYIFRTVQEDYGCIETLRACTLVCHAWTIPAQKYLLDTIYIDIQSIKRFLDLVDGQPRFYGYIKRLYFNKNFVHTSIDAAVALERVAPFLTRVDNITIFMGELISVSPASHRFLEIFADNFSRLRSLHIQSSHVSLDTFFDLIRGFPSLKKLILVENSPQMDGLYSSSKRQKLLAAKRNPPCLADIGCHINSAEIAHVIAWLAYHHKLEHLALFRLDASDKNCIDPDPVLQMSRLLAAVGPRVKHLRLVLPHHQHEIQAFRACPLLSENVSLEELWLDLPWEISPGSYAQAGHAVPMILSQISSYRLEKILLSLRSRKETDINSFPWEEVDELLGRYQFQALKCLTIRHNYSVESLPLKLPRLNAKGVVSIDTSGKWFGTCDFTT
ncbi:hypothetical protein BU17DRAFT_62404 [Hysterangium stoloniferum]|nr:hypothetical protein BU17DRAFT_62404 [Hysterangium stoloniferum]